MASVNISEDDFTHIAAAANDALDRRDFEAARALDKIARKINAALSYSGPYARLARAASGKQCKPLSYRDMPSTFSHRKLPDGFHADAE